MAEVWERWGTVVAATALAVPLAVAVVWALARWRLRAGTVVGASHGSGAADSPAGSRVGGGTGAVTGRAGARGARSRVDGGTGPGSGRAGDGAREWRRSAAEVGAVAGTVPWLWMVMTPRPAASTVNPVPLSDLAALATATPTTIVVQLVGNLLVFAALGFCLPIRFRVGLGAVAWIAALGAVGIEVLQFVLGLGRVSTVDDVLVNTLGAVLAAGLSRPWWERRREDGPSAAAAGAEAS